MIQQFHLRHVFVYILALLFTGCNATPKPSAPILQTHATVASESKASANTPKAITPTITATRAAAIETPSPTASLVPTRTPAPTWAASQIHAFVKEMLATNGNCELPCWWGIVPGEATRQTLQQNFGIGYEGFNRKDGTVLYEDIFEVPASSGSTNYYLHLGFVEKDSVITAIEVSSEIYETTRPGYFVDDWHLYSLEQILNRYGIPSHVQIQVHPPLDPGNPSWYGLTIIYENYGFWIRYDAPATFGDPKMRVCPVFDQVHMITLRLQAKDARTPLFQPNAEGYDRTLEAATGMSLKEFYEKFKDANQRACLESPPTFPEN